MKELMLWVDRTLTLLSSFNTENVNRNLNMFRYKDIETSVI